MIRQILITLTVGIAWIILAPTSVASSVRTVILSEDQAPGANGTFRSIEGGAINNAGDVAFSTFLDSSKPGESWAIGIWAERNASLELVARTGNEAPGTQASFVDMFSPQFNDAGEVAFIGFFDGPSRERVINRGIWSTQGGVLHAVATTDTEAPEIGGLFNYFDPIWDFNNEGQVAFLGPVSASNVEPGYQNVSWVGDANGLNLVARAGNGATGENGVFEPSFYSSGLLTDSGQVVFEGGFTDPADSTRHISGLWKYDDAQFSSIVRTGDSLPALDATFGGPRAFDINNHSHVAYVGWYSHTDDPSLNIPGLWLDMDQGRQLIAKRGSVAEGTDEVFTYFHPLELTDTGHLLVRGYLSDGREGLWSYYADEWSLVHLDGEEATGTESPMEITGLPDINEKGRLLYSGRLADDTTNFRDNDTGVWIRGLDEQQRLIAKTGTEWDLDPGHGVDLRTIQSVSAFGQTDSGLIGLGASFTDGTSGLFVFDPTKIPEPNSCAMLILGLTVQILTRPAVRAAQQSGGPRGN